MNFKIFGAKIKEFRKLNNLTQKDLSDKLGISRVTLSYYERASIEPNIYTVLKLSEIMKCSLDSLLGSSYTEPKFSYLDEVNPITTLDEDKVSFKEKLESLKYIIKKTEKTFIELEMSKKRTDSMYGELEMSKKRNNSMYSELEMSKKRTDRMYGELEMSKKRTDSMYSELEMSKKRTDRMYDEMKRAKNRFMKFDEVLATLDILDDKIKVTDNNVIDLEKYKNEVSEEIFPYIEPKTYTPILYVGKVSAGTPAFAFENIIDTYNIDSSKLCNCKDYFILKVDGDSMNKLYLDGELILIERTNLVNNNDLVIALVDGDTALFKRILIDEFSLLGLKPESSNPIHETKWHKKEDIYVLGKVIGALKDYID